MRCRASPSIMGGCAPFGFDIAGRRVQVAQEGDDISAAPGCDRAIVSKPD